MFYLIAAIWILVGTVLYVLLVTNSWSDRTNGERAATLKFKSFVWVILFTPALILIGLYIFIHTEISFAKWKKANGF